MASALIVDGSAFMKGVLRFILERAGHSVAAMAERREDAASVYARRRPDLVFCDLFLDGEEGVAFIGSLTRAYPEARVIVVAAGGHEAQVKDALRSGARVYLEKPYNVVAVQDAIRVALRDG